MSPAGLVFSAPSDRVPGWLGRQLTVVGGADAAEDELNPSCWTGRAGSVALAVR